MISIRLLVEGLSLPQIAIARIGPPLPRSMLTAPGSVSRLISRSSIAGGSVVAGALDWAAEDEHGRPAAGGGLAAIAGTGAIAPELNGRRSHP